MDSTAIESPSSTLSQADIRSIFSGILLAMFLASLDQTIVATAMPTIGRDLHDLEHLPWVVTAYLLARFSYGCLLWARKLDEPSCVALPACLASVPTPA